LLIAAGADVELVSKLDDQTIQILAQQSLSDITGVTPEKIDVLKGLTIVQIRDILRSFGMTEEDVNALTDEEVTTIYQDALKEFENTPPQL
jgi:predicted RecB family nuclease